MKYTSLENLQSFWSKIKQVIFAKIQLEVNKLIDTKFRDKTTLVITSTTGVSTYTLYGSVVFEPFKYDVDDEGYLNCYSDTIEDGILTVNGEIENDYLIL